jgi:hypothetical protein
LFGRIFEFHKKVEAAYNYYMLEYMVKYPLWGESLIKFIDIKRYIQKNFPLLYRLIDAIPFTYLLYLRYILGVAWVTTFLKYYLGFRLYKIGVKWLYIIWKSFYPPVMKDEEEKIFSRYIFLIFVLVNLQMLGLCFFLLSKYLPQYQHLGLMLYIIL